MATQVDELERVGRLRRFLAPQVADVVMAETGEPLLEPHRTEVAVLFCDLRGFTRFTNSVDADTVVAVLAEYYAKVGAVLEAHGATVGGYEGDGIMAYLGDPIPRSDAAPASVAMAREIGVHLDDLTGRWHADGHDLGYGMGLAYGPATLGVVGFAGRLRLHRTRCGGEPRVAALRRRRSGRDRGRRLRPPRGGRRRVASPRRGHPQGLRRPSRHLRPRPCVTTRGASDALSDSI